MDFRNGKELLDLCREHNLLISDVMRQREITCGSMTNEQIDARLKEILTIMKNAALARRFNEVKVNAPSAEDTFKILQGIRPLYEAPFLSTSDHRRK